MQNFKKNKLFFVIFQLAFIFLDTKEKVNQYFFFKISLIIYSFNILSNFVVLSRVPVCMLISGGIIVNKFPGWILFFIKSISLFVL